MIIAVANFKGGSGKTSTALALAQGLARRKKKVLLMDFDPQCDLTNSLFGAEQDLPYSTYDVFDKGFIDWSQKQRPTMGLDVIPGSLSLIEMEMMLAGKPFRETIITKALEKSNSTHDFIVIDTPPYVGNLTINGIMACDYLLCPVETEYFALKGFHVFRSALERIQCTVDGVIATKYDSRKNLNKDVLEDLQKMEDVWTGIVIRDNVRIAESPYYLQSIYEYSPDSYGAKDYTALVSKIIKTKESWVETKAEAV